SRPARIDVGEALRILRHTLHGLAKVVACHQGNERSIALQTPVCPRSGQTRQALLPPLAKARRNLCHALEVMFIGWSVADPLQTVELRTSRRRSRRSTRFGLLHCNPF